MAVKELTQEDVDKAHNAVKELMDRLVLDEKVPFMIMAATFCTAAASTMATLDRAYGKHVGDGLLELILKKRELAETMYAGMKI